MMARLPANNDDDIIKIAFIRCRSLASLAVTTGATTKPQVYFAHIRSVYRDNDRQQRPI